MKQIQRKQRVGKERKSSYNILLDLAVHNFYIVKTITNTDLKFQDNSIVRMREQERCVSEGRAGRERTSCSRN